jgi:hypothetical protein
MYVLDAKSENEAKYSKFVAVFFFFFCRNRMKTQYQVLQAFQNHHRMVFNIIHVISHVISVN